MKAKRLKGLASNPRFISGVYNYCDRWCERCPLSNRCLTYAMQIEEGDLNDPALRDLFKLYGASRIATLLKLRFPFALPNIMTGLRIAAGLAVIGAIVGEFITGSGLGGLIPTARQQQRVDKVFAILLLSALLGIAMFGLVNLASRIALRHWHASEKPE